MSNKKRGLGKGFEHLGLNALLGDLQSTPTSIQDFEMIPTTVSAQEKQDDFSAADGQLKKIPIDALQPGKYQPRKTITSDALEELANSIRQQGVIQPIVVRPIGNQYFEIIAGERRWRAAKLAELRYIPAIVREINDETAMLMALIENIQRRDLNVMEEAQAFNRLMTEFDMTHQAVADAVGKSRTTVTNILRLLKLHPDVRMLVENNQLEMGHARAILMLPDDRQSEVAHLIVSRNLSVRETEKLIPTLIHAHKNKSVSDEKIMLQDLQERLSAKWGLTISISQNTKGAGKLMIAYKNDRDLQRVLSRIDNDTE